MNKSTSIPRLPCTFSAQFVMERYIRDAEIFQGNVGEPCFDES